MLRKTLVSSLISVETSSAVLTFIYLTILRGGENNKYQFKTTLTMVSI